MKTSTNVFSKATKFALACFFMLALMATSNAQISVSGAGALNGTYTTFTNSSTGLFAALNASNQVGNNIIVSVTGNVTEPTTGVALTGAAGMWSSLTIKPSGGAWTISAAATTDLIDFSGASNVTIDGLNTGGNALTISNTTAGSVAAIRFINDANNIKIKNCTITGSANASQKAVVMFATGTTTGNDNIRITGCDIGAAGTNYPTNCVFSLGTSLAVDNSSDTLDNNTIHDFYSNTLPSFGIHLNNSNASSSNNWFINSNKLYQTVSRAYGTANTHQIVVLGTGAGHVCSNNTIGFASSAGTGTYTVTSGTGATRIVGISVNNTDNTGTPISVQGNTISGFSITSANTNSTTTPTFAGIIISGSGNANIGTVTGNTIGATSGTGSIAVIVGGTVGGAVAIVQTTTGSVNISNNSVGSFSVTSGTATFNLGLYGIYVGAVSSSLTISNNTFGNSTANNMVAGTSGTTTGGVLVGGIYCASVPTALIASNNTIRNFSSYGASTSSFVRGFSCGTSGTTTSAAVYNNTISNLTTTSLLTGTSSGQTSAEGIQFGAGLNAKIYGNTIYNISNSNAAASTTNIVVAGIGIASAQSTSVYNNKIYGLSNANTGSTGATPPMAVGIVIRSGTTNDSVYNNMISLGNGQSTNTVFIGILGTHGSTPDPISYIFHNTINIEGTVSSGALPSFCLHRGDFSTTSRTQTYIIKNNIFTNSRSGGTGKHYAIGNNYNGNAGTTGWTSDFNILNSANTATVGYSAATDQTFASWRTAMGGDVNSYSGVTVTYTNTATGDLHINMGTNNNSIESYGDATVGINTDFDGQVRPGPVGSVNGGAVAPDLGADEFDGVLSFTCTAPGATSVSASVNPVTCYGSSTLLSLTTSYSGTGYQYQWYVSSDNINFTSISGALFPTYSATPNQVTTYYRCTVTCPNGPSSVTSSSITITAPTILAAGTYTINSGVATGGSNFNTFTEAINALNCRGIAGPVVFNVASGSGPYNEQVSLNQVSGASSVNTITINGNGATLSFSSITSTARDILTLNGADYVTIDNLKIDGSGGTYGWGVHILNQADHNTISNCEIKTSTTNITSGSHGSVVFSSSNTTFSTSGITGSYNTITGCTISGGYQAITVYGYSGGYETNNTISNNIIKDYYGYGCFVAYQNNFTFSGNDISRPTRSTTTTTYGLYTSSGGSGYVISGNRIHNTYDGFASTHTNISTGIQLGNTGTLAAPNKVYNNIVYNVTGNGTAYGIVTGGAYQQIYHNTIVFNDANTTTGVTYGIRSTASSAGVEIKNNLVYITRGGTGTKRCISQTVTTTNLVCDFNDYYLNAPAGVDNSIGEYNSVAYNQLIDWKSANSNAYDANGRSIDPQFADVANNDYTPTSGSLDNLGTPVGITTDINNNTRSNTTPDLGAYEFTGTGCQDPPTPGQATSTSSTICSGLSFTLNVINSSIGAGQTFQWQISTDNSNWSNLGSAQSTQTYTTSQTSSHYYRVALQCSGGSIVYSTSVYVNTNPLMNGNYTINKNAASTLTNFTSFAEAVYATGCGIDGPVVIDVVAGSGPYYENVIIPQITGASATNTVWFNGNGNSLINNTNISASRAGIAFDGADHITIDSLNIDVSGGTYGTGILFKGLADSNKVSRCTIDAGLTTVSSNFTAVSFSSSFTSNTTGNCGNYDTLIGCTIKGGYYGFYMNGLTSSPYAQGNAIINNIIQDAYSYPANIGYQNKLLFSGNDISKPTRTAFTTNYGVYISSSVYSSVFEKNKIHDLFAQQPTNTTSAYAIYVSNTPTASTANTIKNNLIYNMNSTGTIYGIYILGSYLNIYHNTIILDQANGGLGSHYGINIGSSYSGLNIKNNFISVTSSSTGAKRCLNMTGIGANNVDYNYYYMGTNYGTNNNVAATGSSPVITYTTLADWQANDSAYDAHSISTVVNFVDAANGNYSPTTASVNDKGTNVGVTTDINGLTRSNTTPDMGCFEFEIQGCTNPPITGTVTVTTTQACSGNNFTLDITGNSFGLNQTYQWQMSTNNSNWTDVGGLLDSTTSFTTSQTSDHYYRVKVTCSLGTPAYSASVFVSTPSLVSGTFTIDATQPTGGSNFASITEAVSYISCGINGPVVFNVVSGTGPYNEQVHISAITGTSGTNTITFNGNGETLAFSSTNAGDKAGFVLIGASHVTINNFVIEITGGSLGTGIWLTSQSDSNTISNNTINAPFTLTSANFSGISISSSVGPTGTGLNGDYNNISGNIVNGTYYGITVVGSSTTRGVGNNVINNRVNDAYAYSIFLTYERDGVVRGNEVTSPNRTTFSFGYGIYLTTGVLNYLVEKNAVHDLYTSATTATTATYCFYVAADATAGNENKLVNNLVYNIGGNGTNYGIYNAGGDYMQAYHNSISLDGTVATTAIAYGVYQSTAAAGLSYINNNISITRSGTGIKRCIYFSTTSSSITSNNNNLYMGAASGSDNKVGQFGTLSYTDLSAWKGANTGAYDQNSVSVDPMFVNVSTGNLVAKSSDLNGVGATNLGVTTDYAGNSRTLYFIPGAFESDNTAPVISNSIVTSSCASSVGASSIDINAVNITDASGISTSGANMPKVYFRKGNSGGWSVLNGTMASGTATNSNWNFSIPYSSVGGANTGDVVNYFIVAQDLSSYPNVASNATGLTASSVTSISVYPTTGNPVAINAVTPSILISTASDTVCSGSNVTFTSDITNGGNSPSVQWKRNNLNVGSGSSITFLSGTLNNGDNISCVLTANNTCQTSSTANSNTILLTVNPSPAMSQTTNSQGVVTTATMCTLGTSVRYYNTTYGGTWSSSASGVASVTSQGIVTANSNGTAIISFSKASASSSCVSTSTVIITVAQATTPSAITGTNQVCVNSTVNLANATNGGVWSSFNNRGIINSSGVFTGKNAGAGEVRYTVTNASGCTAYSSFPITVNALPNVPTINYAPSTTNPQVGATTGGYCVGKTFTVVGSPNIPAGVWSATGVASVTNGGVVTINAAGAGTLKYTYTTVAGCNSSRTISGYGYSCAAKGGNSNEQLSMSNDFTMYPNPAKGFINLSVETLVGSGSIVVTDLYGKAVKTQNLSMGINTVNITNLSKGFYLVSIITSEGKNTKKLIVE